MRLNSEQIIERKILKLDNTKGKPAQVGYDLAVKEIKRVLGMGYVLKDETILPKYQTLEKETTIVFSKKQNKDIQVRGWMLHPGTYEVTFWEGCDISNNLSSEIIQRSSVARCGGKINSSVFDPGFKTEEMGTMISIHRDLFIEEDTRIGQMVFEESEPLPDEKLYNGQFQNDKQRV